MVEPGSRFAHFLQPIRDISKIWKIEIADELEKYIEELDSFKVTSTEDGATQLNFAEAALLIQGSTVVYGRKVELLYQLVYQALDLLSSDKAGGDRKKGRVVQSGLWNSIPDTEELLTIDHLIKEGRNIVMEEQLLTQREASQRRVPLFLMPRDQADRRKKEFRISSCTVHHTGAYLLQESDAKLLDDLLAVNNPCLRSSHPDEPLVPTPPREVHDLDQRLQELLRELPDSGKGLEVAKHSSEVENKSVSKTPKSPSKAGAESDDDQAPVRPKTPKSPGQATPGQLSLPGGAPTPGSRSGMKALGTPLPPLPGPGGAGNGEGDALKPPPPDPWALLDDHATVGKEVPQEVGKTGRRLNTSKLLMKAEGLPDGGDWQPLSDDALWQGNAPAAVAPLLTAGHPVESLFLAVAGQLKSGTRYETQKAGFSAAWLEFEDLFSQANSKRRHVKWQDTMKRRQAADEMQDGEDAAPQTPLPALEESEDEQDADLSINDAAGGDLVVCPTPIAEKALTEELIMQTPLRPPNVPQPLSEEKQRFAEHREEVSKLEAMIEDAQKNYENTIRMTLQKMQQGQIEGQKGMPELYRNVRRWQEQLEPVLREFDSRPDYDMFEYSNKILTKISDINKGSQPNNSSQDESMPIPFWKLAHGQPRWEVCRRFLTVLILTNSGHTDILVAKEQDRLNNFSVKLLKSEKKMLHCAAASGDVAEEDLPSGAFDESGKPSAKKPKKSAQSTKSASAPTPMSTKARKSLKVATPQDAASAPLAPASQSRVDAEVEEPPAKRGRASKRTSVEIS